MIFIETVVGEMNVRVAEILLGRLLVVLNAKSSQPFLIEVANIGTNCRYEHVKPQIELFLPQQQRLVDIGLNYPLLIGNLRNV